MPLIIKLFSFISIAAFANANLSMEMQKKIHISEGEYKLTKGEAGCLAGSLKYIESDGFVGLKLGASLIAQGINKELFEYIERDCKFKNKNKITEKVLRTESTQDCKGEPSVVRTTEIHRIAQGFVYTLKTNQAGKSISDLNANFHK